RRRRRRCSGTSPTRSTSCSTVVPRREGSRRPSSTRPWTRHAFCARARCGYDGSARRVPEEMRVTGVIQAGGKSTRMGGRPKALLELGGRRIVERVVAAVAPAVDGLLVVTNTPELYAFLGLPMVGDVYPDHGSLGGIYSGLRAAPGDAAFTVACDMPFLHPDVVRLVVARADEGDVVIPRVGGQWETLHAAYAKSCLPHIEARLVAGRLNTVEFFEGVRVVEIAEAALRRYPDPALVVMNRHTPEELERAQVLAAHLAQATHG